MKTLAQSIDDRVETSGFEAIELVILQVDVVNYLTPTHADLEYQTIQSASDGRADLLAWAAVDGSAASTDDSTHFELAAPVTSGV